MIILFLVALILLICVGVAICVLFGWWAKSKGTTSALNHDEKHFDLDDSLLQDADDRKTSFHLIEAARWPI